MNNFRRQFLTRSVQMASAAAISNIIPIHSFANTLNYGPEPDIAQWHWNENF
ncbi:uncharacterized protein METZ01_LOCUS382720, partial [marine metagenome]